MVRESRAECGVKKVGRPLGERTLLLPERMQQVRVVCNSWVAVKVKGPCIPNTIRTAFVGQWNRRELLSLYERALSFFDLARTTLKSC